MRPVHFTNYFGFVSDGIVYHLVSCGEELKKDTKRMTDEMDKVACKQCLKKLARGKN